MRHPSLIILEALLDGELIKIGNETYAMSEDNNLVAVRQDSEGNQRLLKTFADLAGFIKLSESVSEDVLVGICANKALRLTTQARLEPTE